MLTRLKLIPLYILIVCGLTIYTILVLQEFDTAYLNVFLRYTGIVSFLLFTLSFGISGIHYFFRNAITQWVLIRRKAFGLTFAGFFAIHFSLIGVKSIVLGANFNANPNLGASLVVIAVIIMSITSISSIVKKLGPFKWKTIHLICGLYISLGLINFYTMSLNRIDHALAFLVLLYSMLALKLVMYIHRFYVQKNRTKKVSP